MVTRGAAVGRPVSPFCRRWPHCDVCPPLHVRCILLLLASSRRVSTRSYRQLVSVDLCCLPVPARFCFSGVRQPFPKIFSFGDGRQSNLWLRSIGRSTIVVERTERLDFLSSRASFGLIGIRFADAEPFIAIESDDSVIRKKHRVTALLCASDMADCVAKYGHVCVCVLCVWAPFLFVWIFCSRCHLSVCVGCGLEGWWWWPCWLGSPFFPLAGRGDFFVSRGPFFPLYPSFRRCLPSLTGFTGFYQTPTQFYWVLPSFTEFYRVLPSFTEFYRVEFYRVLPCFTEFYRVLSSFTEFYRVLPSFAEFCRVLPSFAEFYCFT